jgi:hypothetical protein
LDKIDLKNITFIIPIRIDSSDRLRNIFLTVSYLINNFDTNIIIKESDKQSLYTKYLSDKLVSKNIKYIYEKNTYDHFHRTRLLNDMILESNTEIVCNYDADIILPLNSYVISKILLESGYDIVYPFKHGIESEKKVLFAENINYLKDTDKLIDHEFIKNNLDINILENNYFFNHNAFGQGFADFGMCQFFKRNVYIEGFLENEDFVSYAPEDKERYYRFKELGYKICRVDNSAFHLEHARNHNSSSSNPYMQHNNNLWSFLGSLKKEEIIKYYKNRDYYVNRTK